jgi:type IX secretion system PorP/SprF family membrane protein
MKRIVLLFSVLILIAQGAKGQADPVTNQYVLNPVAINPAFSGGRGALNIFTFYGKQWVGIDGSPANLTVSLDAPFANQKLGLGLMISNDRVGVTKENMINTSYAYRIKIDEGVLAFGLGAGIVLTNTAYSDLIVLDPGDEIYLQDTKIFGVPNFSFGVHYSLYNFSAGLSIPRLLNYRFDFASNKYVFDNNAGSYSYLLNAGYKLEAAESINIYPSVLIRYASIPDPSKFQFDINAHVSFYDKFWLGGSYRNKRSVAAMFQFQPTSQLRIGYSYNFEISQLGRYTNGSHEIMMNYLFKYRVEAVNPLNF